MAKVTYAAGIDTVSGALAKPKKKEGHTGVLLNDGICMSDE